MKIKFNWLTGIIIFMVLFFISIIVRVVISFNHEVDLITPDYYPKAINYQQQIEKINHTNSLQKKVSYTYYYSNKTLALQFPVVGKHAITGNILVYRPSAMDKDLKIEIATDSLGNQTISTKDLLTGKYILKIDWLCDSVAYYQEMEVVVR